MALLSTHTLARLLRQIDKGLQFNLSLNNITKNNWAPALAQKITAIKEEIDLPFVNDSGKLILGERGIPPREETLLGEKLTIKLQQWGAAIIVSIFDVSEDDTGEIARKAKAVGSDQITWMMEQMAEIWALGETNNRLMHDGLSLFDNIHPKGGTTFDNLLTGVLDPDNYQAAKVAMARVPSDLGPTIPTNNKPSHLIVPSELGKAAAELIFNKQLGSQADVSGRTALQTENIFINEVQVIETPFLTDPNDWYLIDSNDKRKAFLFAVHRDFGPKVLAFTDPKDENVNIRKQFKWTIEIQQVLHPTKPELHFKFVNV